MPLPKAIRDALAAKLKDGEAIPAELDSGIFFENEGDFLTTVEKKSKSKLTEADRKAANAAKEAREAALNEIFEKLGVTDPDQLDDFKGRLADAEGTRSELEKVKAELVKTQKESAKAIGALTKVNDELLGFKTTHVKRGALSPHLSKIHPDLRDVVEENLLAKLAIDGDKVTGPEGKAIDSLIDEMIKAKPSLKAPDFKGGAATGPGGGKASGDSAGGNASASNGQAKDPPKTIREAVAQSLAEQAAKETAGASGP